MKTLIKKFIPKLLLNWYHKALALLAAVVYGYPSKKMTVVGVTGTNGKSTTVALIVKALEAGGAKVGATSTVSFKIADKEWLNDKKMTMLGRFQLQKLLKQMVCAGCKYAVIEVSSEGIKQHRHLGISFDYAVFTNLTPEHIESHGGFENYKIAKGKLFAGLKDKGIIVANLDDKHAEYFLNFKADKKITFGVEKQQADFVAKDVLVSLKGTAFEINNEKINLKLIGAFNVYNALPAIAIGAEEGVSLEKIKTALESVDVVSGRMEIIDIGQSFSVLVDYAPEPASMEQLYKTIKIINKDGNKIIHVLGSCGGGRDKDRRPKLGKIAGENADIVIVTNEDPYDDEPMEIIKQVAEGALGVGKELDKNLFKIQGRKEAIHKALRFANENDLVLITGKGAEQVMAVKGGKHIPWDDREVVKSLLVDFKTA